jgi:SAM-dependent methyltransferase
MQDNIYNRKAWVDAFIRERASDASDAERVRKILEAVPGDVTSVLDVGVGGGYIYRELKKRFGAGCFGLDVSLELLKRLKDATTCVADAQTIPFRDGEFDLVIAADLIEHIKDEFFDSSILELIRVSRKYLLINSPYKDSIDWPVSLCGACGREFNVYGHVRSVDMDLVREVFPPERFEIVRTEVFGNKRDARPKALAVIARRLGKVYSSEGVICPHCLNSAPKLPERNFAENLLGGMVCGTFFLMDRLIPSFLKKGSEIYVLLKKKRI